MKFKDFKRLFQEHVKQTLDQQTFLFVVDVDGDSMWQKYLDSFPDGANNIFRERGEFDCSCCRSFIKRFGNVVAIKDNKLVTIWDFDTGNSIYKPVVNALSKMVKTSRVKDVFITKEKRLGVDQNYELTGLGTHVWRHFFIDLPSKFVTTSPLSVGQLASVYRDERNVFERSLNEISIDAVEIVLDLIAEKTLYKGDEWKRVLNDFLRFLNEYWALPEEKRENYCWIKSTQVDSAIAKIKNHSIGVLLTDITGGMDVVNAVKRYEKMVAPENYKRPKPIFTKRMVEEAEKTVTELGLLNSLGRRFAVLEDITINNVLWANRDAAKQMDNMGVFDALKQDVLVDPKSFSYAKTIDIEGFINDILPTAKSIEVLIENNHQKNLASLIAPEVKGSKTLFKWNNNFSWSYNGNLTDSTMKERVKMAGGNVEGVFRFSIQWNHGERDDNDLDAHCTEPNGNVIYFGNKGKTHSSSGMLDVDIIEPIPGQAAVENITWQNIHKMIEGVYKLYVNNYSYHGGDTGFQAEIEFNGQTYEYEYQKPLMQSEVVNVAKVKFSKKDGFSFVESLPSTKSQKTVWGLKTNQFHPVSVVTLSPNYWDEQRGIGHKHYLFMLAGCVNDTQPNGFFNEYLKQEIATHKRVFAALGNKMKVKQSDNQLSGLGFSSTKRANLIIKVNGNKVYKIIF
jgi:hypothetical protein